jgi:hypothetical protein
MVALSVSNGADESIGSRPGSVRAQGCNSLSLLDATYGSGQSQNKMGQALYKLAILLILKNKIKLSIDFNIVIYYI